MSSLYNKQALKYFKNFNRNDSIKIEDYQTNSHDLISPNKAKSYETIKVVYNSIRIKDLGEYTTSKQINHENVRYRNQGILNCITSKQSILCITIVMGLMLIISACKI